MYLIVGILMRAPRWSNLSNIIHGQGVLLVDSANDPNIQAPNVSWLFKEVLMVDFTTGVLSRIRLRNFSEKMAEGLEEATD